MPDPAIIIEARRALRESVAVYNRILAARFDHKRALKELGEKLLPYRRQVPFGVWADLLAEFGINRHTWRRAKALAEGRTDYWKNTKQLPDNCGETHHSGVIRSPREIGGDTGDARSEEEVSAAAAVRGTMAAGAVARGGGAVVAMAGVVTPAGAEILAVVAGGGGANGKGPKGKGPNGTGPHAQMRLDVLYKEAESLRVELETRMSACLALVRSGDSVGVQALRASRDAIKAVMEGL